ncbi:hypothetical protein A3F07_01460 [candidate division WWE3 bacterium RIFCSPHIGHO2_12_FULL_38_15]|uniref:Uncharacterized protein n=1 Tax=candidate division WWE3 bacterium RIFCSPHIGHO2_02_FULL_38_14 TaxID=1802620 RepID=A0A1F4V9U1_UNCKA|nr:MAG: hypothetical protein A2793_01835 [candidate division WWE3 bacterium RIFCSPHIGHO2_01_FULL_38_45]OGC48372.1 MAG: hypothetical protein A3F07_01460 [candidate division WWE3 bacterium RIFCSPHIGHO2_12_FULL_38_15]OGC53650.1 MAG: hypothetical protein A3D91_04390 [candidate division WWE3 bacterium RIFCSPHIGHO2_02_FULL_38_14]OGC54307.1 MAG: hypothetical protein A3B64_02260 [candidate division WWE3 bacterium RIFCSPLOWO2_01_FULL_37_24]HLB51552.1 hypothetical protein [Patescibacteria group bacterium
MNNPYQLTKNTIQVIDEILVLTKDTSEKNENIKTIFLSLVLAERVLDIERVILPPGSGINFPNDKKFTEENLDRIRNEIWKIRKMLNENEVKDILESAGNNLKTRFLIY